MSGSIAPLVALVTVTGLVFALHPRVRRSRSWRATVTPLASIIGSGFLVVAPLLASSVGSLAPAAMLGIVTLAFGVGAVIRFNIRNLEPVLAGANPSHTLLDLERLAELALGFAYVISVAFYIRLLASFALRPFDGDISFSARVFTTVVLCIIGAVAWFRGLLGLEVLEEAAVAVKLAIIMGLFAGLIWYDLAHWSGTISAYDDFGGASDAWTTLRYLAGMLLVVQGFETSRYLGAEYDGAMRVKTMRHAQLISGGIYVVFITLMVPLFGTFPSVISDTAILDAAREVTTMLVPLLVIAAAASQLSAGVADTAGGGGMFMRGARSDREHRAGYIAVLFGAGTVVWATDVFSIIVLASRAFALYYLLQTTLAILCAPRVSQGSRLAVRWIGMGLIAAALGFIALAGIPSG